MTDRRIADLRTTPDLSTALYQGEAYRSGNLVFFFAGEQGSRDRAPLD